MKKRRSRYVFKAIFLIASMMFALTGCGKTFDASRYVKGCLDASTKGVFTDYCDMTNSTEEEAKTEYETKMNTELESMTGSITMTDEMRQRYLSIYKQIYSKCKYEVGEAKEGKDKSYTVPVKICRLNIFKSVLDETQQRLQQKVEEMIQNKQPTSTEQTMQVYVDILAGVFEEKLQNPEYGAEETITVTIAVNSSSNEYEIADEDVVKLFAALDDADESQQ